MLTVKDSESEQRLACSTGCSDIAQKYTSESALMSHCEETTRNTLYSYCLSNIIIIYLLFLFSNLQASLTVMVIVILQI